MSNPTASYLNQIFYKHKKFDNPDDIQCLEKWMLSSDNMDKLTEPTPTLSTSIASPTISPVITCPPPPFTSIPTISPVINCAPIKISNIHTKNFKPHKEDTLFWCAYTAFHGEPAYHIIGNRYKNTEIQEKLEILNYIKANPAIIKLSRGPDNKKLSQSRIMETQAELMVNKKTSWATFFIMCLFYKIQAIVLCEHTNTYLEFCPNIPAGETLVETFIFWRSRDGHFSVNLTPAKIDQLAEIRNSRILLDYSSPSPLKSVSSFKMPELEEIATKLGITIAQFVQPEGATKVVKPKKADWYDAIMERCLWTTN